MSPCPSAEQLRDWLADRLTSAEAKVVEAHVEACVHCQQTLEELTSNANRPRGGRASRTETGAEFLQRLEQEPPSSPMPLPERGACGTCGACARS
jgi:hypothetical protein